MHDLTQSKPPDLAICPQSVLNSCTRACLDFNFTRIKKARAVRVTLCVNVEWPELSA